MNKLETILRDLAPYLDNGRGVDEISVTVGGVLWSDGCNWYEFNPLKNPSDFVILLEHYEVEIEYRATAAYVTCSIWNKTTLESVEGEDLRQTVVDIVYKFINNLTCVTLF